MDTLPNNPTAPIWRVLRLAAIGLLGLAALVVVLIAAGVFDPRPLGRLSRTDIPGVHTLPTTGAATFPQSVPWATPPDCYSVRLRAAYASGQADIGYGLALGDEGGRLVVAVSPFGYASVWEERGGETINRLPWQPWPHVRIDQAENEIWLDVTQIAAGAKVTAWVNREQLWRDMLNWQPDGIDLWMSSINAPAAVDFTMLQWYVGHLQSNNSTTSCTLF